MKKLVFDFKNAFVGMNKISAFYIKYGNMILYTVIIMLVTVSLCLGRVGNYDYLMWYRAELQTLLGNMFTVTYVPALLIELVSKLQNIN